ncbi:MAG: flagellar hook-length control protein FliK [Phycisphaerales bacterium]
MNIKLYPESLGAVRVQMSVAQGRVAVQFHAETAEARALLTQSMDTLRQALEGQGLKVDRMSVQALGRNAAANSGSGSGQDGNDGSPREREQSSGDRNAGEGRSRGFSDAQDEASRRRQNLRDPRQSGHWSSEFRRLHEERSQSEELNHD